ncbi:MAG: hypothetical protein JNM63_02820, partial [Spirochaetia bacterium]|nr:hypothetical protein [Spirochaetia bacterium]
MKRFGLRLILFTLLFSGSQSTVFSQIIYVATNGNDGNNGLSPATAVRTIQLGITKALQNGFFEIDVSQGLYTNGAGLNTPAVGRGVLITNDSLRIMGGWNLSFAAQSGVSELDGNGLLTNIIFVTNANSLFINNFTIRRGYAPTTGLLTGSGAGLFLWNVNGSTFSSLVISNNTGVQGGGVFVTNSSGNIFQMTVQSNASTSFGGGIHIGNSHSNRFSGLIVSNQGLSGGGMWALTSFANTINADFNYNRGGSGAGLYLFSSDSNTVNGNFSGNVGTGDGGAAYVFSASNFFSGAMNS